MRRPGVRMALGASPHDPYVFLTVAAVLTLAGIAAAVASARRSGAVDPLVVLRVE